MSGALGRPLALYLASRFCSGTAMTLLRASLLWQLWALTHDVTRTGLLGIVMFVPGVSLSLVGGAFADAHDRRRIVQGAQSVALCLSAVLCALSVVGIHSVWPLYAVAAGLAACAAFENPARAALLSMVVDEDELPRAVTWGATVQALSFATGPALAGGLIAGVSISAAFGAHALLLASSVVLLFFVDVLRPGARRAASWSAVAEGLRFVARSPVLLSCMTLDLVAVVLGGANALLPVYADRILDVGAPGFGVLTTAVDAGALLMSVVLVRMPPILRAGRALLVAVFCYGLATIAFGASTWFPLSIGVLALCGAADQVSVVLRQSAVQLSTPDELRGRVSAVNMVFIIASNQLSIAESGFVAAWLGAERTVIAGGVGVLVVVAVVALLVPALVRFEMPRAAGR